MARISSTMQRDFPVRNLQLALRTISEKHPNIDKVVPDGIYGPETTRAVTQFQKQFGLPETGQADPDTWDRIHDIYFELMLERKLPEPLFAFPTAEIVIGPGDSGDVVYIIQVVLSDISRRFFDFQPVTISGIYDAPTEREVTRFQARTLLPESGRVDRTTWDRLARFYRPRSFQSPA